MEDKIYNFMDYWVYLRQIKGSTADEALWIILDDIGHAEDEYICYHHGKLMEGFSEFLGDCKTATKFRIKLKKSGLLNEKGDSND